MNAAKLEPGIAPPKHDISCTRLNGACVNLHCPRCGLPTNVMGHHRDGLPCKPTHTGSRDEAAREIT